jgi:guanosine-3',5'-bis(diphosphate) 3'-pyrophosphohydrolase
MISFKEYYAYRELEEDAQLALRFAAKKHRKQSRADGTPYITHPVRVAQYIKQYKNSHNLDALISAAYLHDTIEDTNTTHKDLRKMFGGLVATLVKDLTSDKDEIEKLGKSEYLSRKMSGMSSWALVIKLADRLDNVQDISTAKTPEWRRKYKQETESVLSRLERERVLTGTHKKLITMIRNKLKEVK